jgi:hypothetical protein
VPARRARSAWVNPCRRRTALMSAAGSTSHSISDRQCRGSTLGNRATPGVARSAPGDEPEKSAADETRARGAGPSPAAPRRRRVGGNPTEWAGPTAGSPRIDLGITAMSATSPPVRSGRLDGAQRGRVGKPSLHPRCEARRTGPGLAREAMPSLRKRGPDSCPALSFDVPLALLPPARFADLDRASCRLGHLFRYQQAAVPVGGPLRV